ncbi:hypothetical protein BdWA1_002818 [Babesia duncani]|uniref:Uncharacterized protein n=1 Tax=Babesia duncani TaxID=323732 RepID=A0AAD9PJZ5_9APIC|nr:hypothetical protein BdWA1_002818 [Babesia duncani]
MLPKYGSHDVLCESFEAQLLIQQQRTRPVVTATLISAGLLPRDIRGVAWESCMAVEIWLREMQQHSAEALINQLNIVQSSLAKHVPPIYDISDETIYNADWNSIFTSNSMWPWDRQEATTPLESSSPAPHPIPQSLADIEHRIPTTPDVTSIIGEHAPRYKRVGRKSDRNAGCIRYESNRKRWVVDLSSNGKRLQKCFHETYFGIVGGLQEARRWRLNFIKEKFGSISLRLESKFMSDLLEKILAMPSQFHEALIQALKMPISGFENVHCDALIDDLLRQKATPPPNPNEK